MGLIHIHLLMSCVNGLCIDCANAPYEFVVFVLAVWSCSGMCVACSVLLCVLPLSVHVVVGFVICVYVYSVVYVLVFSAHCWCVVIVDMSCRVCDVCGGCA